MIHNTRDSVVIIANGDFPQHKIPLKLLLNAKYLVCCDGAINKLDHHNIKPNCIIGDLDSISPSLKDKYKNILIKKSTQDHNDLRKAIKWTEKLNLKQIDIIGISGKREDHTISNIFTILQFPCKSNLIGYSNYGKFSIVSATQTFNSYIGQKVSIFSTDKKILLTTTNLKYSLNNEPLHNIYSGSLNESICSNFII